MAKVTKKEQGMLDLIRSYFMKMRNHSTKAVESIHVSKAQFETFLKMREKALDNKSDVIYGGVEFYGDKIKIDGIEILHK